MHYAETNMSPIQHTKLIPALATKTSHNIGPITQWSPSVFVPLCLPLIVLRLAVTAPAISLFILYWSRGSISMAHLYGQRGIGIQFPREHSFSLMSFHPLQFHKKWLPLQLWHYTRFCPSCSAFFFPWIWTPSSCSSFGYFF